MELGLRQSVDYAGPELALVMAALVIASIARLRNLERRGLGEIAILGAAISVLLAARLSGWGEVWLFERLFVVDGLAIFFKITIGFATVTVLWIWLESTTGSREGEIGALILIAALALDLAVSAAQLASVFVSVELASFALWLLCRPPSKSGLRRQWAVARVVSVAMLGAIAWLAGFTGAVDYERIRIAIFDLGAGLPPPAVISATLVVLALAAHVFAATSAPGARVRLPLAAFLAVAFSAAGIGLGVRWLFAALSRPGFGGHWASPDGVDWGTWLAAGGVTALMLGNLAALRERSLVRLLAAGSIVQLGFALLGASAMSDSGLQATLFQIAASSLANLGAFHGASLITRGAERDSLEACHGLLGEARSFVGGTLAVFLLSLSGVPPLAGFFARVELVQALVEAGRSGLAGLAIASSLLLLPAYGRVLRALYAPAAREIPPLRFYDLLLSGLFAAATLAFGVYPPPLADLASRSIQFLPR